MWSEGSRSGGSCNLPTWPAIVSRSFSDRTNFETHFSAAKVGSSNRSTEAAAATAHCYFQTPFGVFCNYTLSQGCKIFVLLIGSKIENLQRNKPFANPDWSEVNCCCNKLGSPQDSWVKRLWWWRLLLRKWTNPKVTRHPKMLPHWFLENGRIFIPWNVPKFG